MNTGYIKEVGKHHLRAGKARDPYEPTKYGIACIGNVKNYPLEDYKRWENMIERCYRQGGSKNYKDVSVCKRWLVFEYFYKDIQTMENYGLPRIHLDKDLKVKNNKTYSLETCQFINDNLNSSKGSFSGSWKATKGNVTIYATYSTELANLLNIAASAIRNKRYGGRTLSGWNISVEE